ncbi:TetR/AcrR family transcriptional regulator [Salinithrix halophila]|uniref:TetR/AcrR family transcriptional regulator n=1 Tax=Salinithrix halophila TaxID=1485204 RepID=A0ABV8JDK6_9BACL
MKKPLLFASNMPTDAREKLLFSALQLFTAKSFQETTILEVVERARVSKTTFYHFFSGKEDLLASLFDRLAQEILNEVQLAIAREERAAYKGYAGIRRYVELCLEHSAVAWLLLILSVGISPRVEEERRKAHCRFSELIQYTVQGVLSDQVSPTTLRLVSHAMVGAINEVVIQRFTDTLEGVEVEEMARLLNRLVVGAFTDLTLNGRSDKRL